MNLPVGYLIGLGSNIAPEKNLPEILRQLLGIHPQITLSRVLRTEPKGIDSAHAFLNAVVFLPTSLPADELKRRTNAIEINLGRDRSRPDKKKIDRTADIDLLMKTHPTQLDKPLDTIESYLLPSAREVIAYISGAPLPAIEGEIVSIALEGVRLGEAPTTIHCDDSTGLIRIIQHA